MAETPSLRRSVSLPLLTLYGLGTTIGAGIFVLIGKVAGTSGALAPLSFLLASVLAGLSAFSFAELSSRFPESGGEAVYAKEGLGSDALALIVGLMVVVAAVVSTATIMVGFAGYLGDLVAVPKGLAIVATAVLLGGIAAVGIGTSVVAASLVTVCEVGTLLFIVGAGASDTLVPATERFVASLDTSALANWSGILAGTVLAFYAFLGFEDMVNIAEETADAPRTMPRAIVLTLATTTVIYFLVASIAVEAVPAAELAASGAPLALVFERLTGLPGQAVSAIAIVSVLNGALIQIIMASRMLYGLTRRGWLRGPLDYVHPRTQTPVKSIAVCVAIVVALALTTPLQSLAVAASLVTLCVFAVVNLALIRLKRRQPIAADEAHFRTAAWVPVAGFVAVVFVIAMWLGERLI